MLDILPVWCDYFCFLEVYLRLFENLQTDKFILFLYFLSYFLRDLFNKWANK